MNLSSLPDLPPLSDLPPIPKSETVKSEKNKKTVKPVVKKSIKPTTSVFKPSSLPILGEEKKDEKKDQKILLKEMKIKKEKREREEYLKWRESLKEYLRFKFLPHIISKADALDKLVSDEAMNLWEIAFTHESFDPNRGKNYEELEITGDSYLEAAYIKFIRQVYPNLNRSQLSELRTVYLAKPFLANLSQKLGLGGFVRTRYGKSIHMHEDVVEAVFGALEKLGDDLFKFGAGAGLTYNLVLFLYKDVEIDLEATKANPKTRVKEIYERLGIINPQIKEKVPEEISVDAMGKVNFIISMPKSGINLLNSLGIKLSSPIVANVTANTKTVASNEAYALALKNLSNLGLTQSFVDNFVKQKDLSNLELQTEIESVQNRLSDEGYTTFYFNEEHVKSTSGGKTDKYVQLIGIKSDGTKNVLIMTPEPVDVVLQAKKDLLIKYKNYQDLQ